MGVAGLKVGLFACQQLRRYTEFIIGQVSFFRCTTE